MHNIELVVVAFFFFFLVEQNYIVQKCTFRFLFIFFQGLGNTIWYFQAFQDHGKCKKK